MFAFGEISVIVCWKSEPHEAAHLQNIRQTAKIEHCLACLHFWPSLEAFQPNKLLAVGMPVFDHKLSRSCIPHVHLLAFPDLQYGDADWALRSCEAASVIAFPIQGHRANSSRYPFV